MAKRFGVMIDVSRNGVMLPEELKRYMKTLSDLGYNMVQLYTEDTYECDNEPYFGYLRGRYTKEELKDIVAYANEIGVEVIPCIQTLAHLERIFKWKEYKAINDTTNILLVGEERTYQLIDNMFKTWRECVTTDYIHIGMDEAHMLGLGKYLDKHGYQNRFGILKEHLERVIEIAKKYNFKPIMWSDMFFRLASGGNYYDYSKITDEVSSVRPEGVDLVYWDYYNVDRDFFDGMLEAHKKFGGETWFAGGAWTWMGPVPITSFAISNMTTAMEACSAAGVDNIMLCEWGDDGNECSRYAVLPALYAIKRAYDGVTDMDIVRREFYEITGESYDNMLDLELPNCVAGNKRQSPSSTAKTMLYSDPLFGFLDVTVKSGVGEEFARHSDTLREHAKESKNFAHLYETEAALCDIMEIKYDLGARTRAAYKTGDKAALAALLDDYADCIERVKEYYKAFSYQWHKENKPNGFEVQDHRYGGLMMRLDACISRIGAYLGGEIDTLPELDEELLPFAEANNNCYTETGFPSTEGNPSFDRRAYSLTVNGI